VEEREREKDKGGRNYREHLERSRAEGFNPLNFGVTGRISYNLNPMVLAKLVRGKI
jgi:hypothetical protein